MSYDKVHDAWEDLPSTNTPVDAAALDQIEQGIADAADGADAAGAAASDASTDLATHLADPSNAHDATAVHVSAIDGLSATNAQAALEEIQSNVAASGQVAEVQAGTGIDVDTSNPQEPVVSIEAGVYRSGGTDVPITDGGTGASTASAARTNLGLGTIATQDADNVAITGGSITGVSGLGGVDPALGVSSITRDGDGLVTDVTAGGYAYTGITRTDGRVSSYTLDGVAFTVNRDGDGRVTTIEET